MDVRPIDANELMELYNFPQEYAEMLHVPIPVVVQNIIDMPTIDLAPKWISVKDRLPETTDVYLVNAMHRYNKNDGYRSPQIRLYFKDDNEWQGLPDLYEVTHWMPLPKPPKEDEKDD